MAIDPLLPSHPHHPTNRSARNPSRAESRAVASAGTSGERAPDGQSPAPEQTKEQDAEAAGDIVALSVPVTWEQVAALAGGGAVGHPHIARAMFTAEMIDEPTGEGSMLGELVKAVLERALESDEVLDLLLAGSRDAAGQLRLLPRPLRELPELFPAGSCLP